MEHPAAQPSLSPQMEQAILDSPAQAPPPGYTSNLAHPSETLHAYTTPTLALGIALPTLFVAIRVYTRAWILRNVGWDDYTIVVAWALAVAYVAQCESTAPYSGIHMWDSSVRNLYTLLQGAEIAEIIYNPAIAVLKVSILLQYRRIFLFRRHTTFGLFLLFWAVFGATVCFYTIRMFVYIFRCTPREKEWNLFVSGTCLSTEAILLSGAIFNVVSDVLILVLPQYHIWHLKLSRRNRIGISVTFGIGVLACILSGLRIQSVLDMVRENDFTWYIAITGFWSMTEVILGIICTCLPVMPAFIRTLCGRQKGSRRSYDSQGWSSRRSRPSWPAHSSRRAFSGEYPRQSPATHELACAPASNVDGSERLLRHPSLNEPDLTLPSKAYSAAKRAPSHMAQSTHSNYRRDISDLA